MRYAQIRSMDTTNGEGIGISLFVQGCEFMCKNCFNRSTWDFNGGKEWTQEIEDMFIELIDKPYISRVSILGGEPLHPNNINDVTALAKKVKETYPDKKIWIWSGYLFDRYIFDKEIIKYADVVVDGRYEEDKQDFRLQFKGSSNQRIWKKINGEWEEEKDEQISN